MICTQKRCTRETNGIHKTCEICKAKYRRLHKVKRNAAKLEKACQDCGGDLEDPTKTRCTEHRLKHNASQLIYKRRKNESNRIRTQS